MFTLKLYLMGLIGLVSVGDGVFFVLPNAQNDATMKHFPVLVCDPSTTCLVSGGADQWADIKRRLDLHVNDAPVAFLLNGERLELAGAMPGPLVRPPAVGHGLLAPLRGAVPENQEEARSLSWLPDLSEIEPRAAVIDPVHVFQPNAARIAAVLPLFIAGRLQAFRFSVVPEEGGEGFVHSLTFRQPGGRPVVTERHAAPDVLEVTMPVPGESVQIHLRPFAGAGAGRTLTIRPRQGQNEAVVLLGNLTPALEGNPPQPVDFPVAHFGMYYGLSKNPPGGALKLPWVGERRTGAGTVNPDPLPRVLVMVSTNDPAVSGVERPICTFASFTLVQ